MLQKENKKEEIAKSKTLSTEKLPFSSFSDKVDFKKVDLSPIQEDKRPSVKSEFLDDFTLTTIRTAFNSESEPKPKEASKPEVQYLTFEDLSCKNEEHGSKYLTLDPRKMTVICKKCILNGENPTNLKEKKNTQILDKISRRDSDNIQCMHNCKTTPLFYCKECNNFTCYNCLMNYHLNHRTDTISYISNTFKDDIALVIKSLTNVIEAIKEKKKNVKEENLKENKSKKNIELAEQLKKQVDLTNDSILSTFKGFLNEFESDFTKLFDGNDKEASEILESIKKNLKYINENLKMLEDFKSTISGSEEFDKSCEEHQKKFEQLGSIKEFIKKSNHFLNRITMLTYNSSKNIQKENIVNTSKSLENSVNFAIKTGADTKTFYLNRFKTFQHNTMKYFKTSSIIIQSYQALNLSGLLVCGLYIHKQNLLSNPVMMQKVEKRDKIDIRVTVTYKPTNQVLISEIHPLYGAVNLNDPIISVYFSNGIKIEPKTSYLITIDNLIQGDNYYGDYWTGSTPHSCIEKNEQIIKCNSSEKQIGFFLAEGIQSDFNEFSSGLIEGIIYTCE